MSNTTFPTSPIVDGNKLLLDSLANKIKSGRELTLVESYMGIISAQAINKPDISNFKITGDILPEVVQGMIINSAG